MPRSKEYTPARRFMMQGIMWIILGATVGLAALVTHHRRAQFEVRLDDLKEYRGVSVQLPKGWDISKKNDPTSSVLVTATEKISGDDKEEQGGRVVRVVRQELPSYVDPLRFAADRLGAGGENSETGRSAVTVARSPGEMLYQVRLMPAKDLREALTGGVRIAKSVCAATVTASGRAIAVELEGDGNITNSDTDLVERIAGSIKLDDEPETIESGEVALDNGIKFQVPADFSTIRQPDPLSAERFLRGSNTSGAMRIIELLPVTMLPKDASATMLTMLSIADFSRWDDAQVRQDSDGVLRADIDLARQLVPARAFLMSKDGDGILAIFHGGADDAWIDPAWQAIHDKLTFPEKSDMSDLVKNGADAAGKMRDAGLKDYLPTTSREAWWLLYLKSPDQALGWWHFTPGARRQSLEARAQNEHYLIDLTDDWLGATDLKSYSASIKRELTDLRQEKAPPDVVGLVASLKAGKVELRPSESSKPITSTAPPNYIPGGWLPLVMTKLVDRPMIVRTDSFFDYGYVQPRDFLTIALRPEPDAKPQSDDSDGKLRCVSVQVSGAPEKALWFFRADGTLEAIDYPHNQHLIRSDEREITTTFSRKEALRP